MCPFRLGWIGSFDTAALRALDVTVVLYSRTDSTALMQISRAPAGARRIPPWIHVAEANTDQPGQAAGAVASWLSNITDMVANAPR
jgi:hypothetical protein